MRSNHLPKGTHAVTLKLQEVAEARSNALPKGGLKKEGEKQRPTKVYASPKVEGAAMQLPEARAAPQLHEVA